MCHQNPSTSSPLAKFERVKTLMSNYFQEVFNSHVSASAGVADAATEDIWNNIKTGLLKTTEVCGTTRPNHWCLETWWWNQHVKRSLLPRGKLSRPGRLVKALGHHTMQPNAFPDMHCTLLIKKAYENIDPKSSEVYHLANQLRGENTDVDGGKLVKNDAGEMSMSKDSKQKAWLEHYRWLLKDEFDCDPEYLSDEPPVEGPPIPITSDIVLRELSLR